MSDRPPTQSMQSPDFPPATRSAGGEILIEAAPERVWRALTEAAELERWFPLEARVEPGEGGSIRMSWRNEFTGEMTIRRWEPPRHLRTAWSFHEADPPGQVTDYYLEPESRHTVLRVVTSGFPLDESWDGWVEGTRRGWAFELRSLKHYLERYPGEKRHVAYVRRRTPLSAPQAWGHLERHHGLARWLSEGEAFDVRAGGQYAATLSSGEGIFRISLEPGAPGEEMTEAVAFLSVWGDRASWVEQVRAEWTAALEEALQEGETR